MSGVQPVRHHERGAALHQFANDRHDSLLRRGVEGGRRFVEQKDRRILEEGPRNTDALALADTEVPAPLANLAGKPVRHAGDEIVGLRTLRRLDDFIFRGFRTAVGDILPHRRREEESVLQDHADIATQRFLGHILQVAVIDQDIPARRIVKPGNQTEERALTGSGPADNGHALTMHHAQIHVVKNLPVFVVAKIDRTHGDIALHRPDRRRIRCVAHIILAVENVETSTRARRRTFHRPGGISQLLQWRIKHEKVRSKDKQITEGQLALEHVERADIVKHRRAGCHEGSHHQGAGHIGEGQPQVGQQALVRPAVELADLAVFLPEGMNHAHRSKPLLHGGQQRTLPFLNGRALGADFFREIVNSQNNQWNDGKGQEG